MRDRPSATAYRVAMSRAAHQLLDRPLLLEDPVALPIVGAAGAAEIRARTMRFNATLARYLRAFVVARSRIAEDALGERVAGGVRQYVILGAGLDTFAYRSPFPAERLQVFEVDHPATQAWKRSRLLEGGIGLPESLRFVPVDFETDTLAERLATSGLRADEPVFFSWLGVSMYLSRRAVLDTFSYVASLPRGSGIVFDYALPPATFGLMGRLLIGAVRRRVAAIGEPWKTFFEPPALAAELAARGFTHLQDLGPDELNARFFDSRSDGLRVGRVGHIACART